MEKDVYEKLIKGGHFQPLWFELLNASGYAGCLPNGNIVDRRYYPEAIPVQKNEMLGVTTPKKL